MPKAIAPKATATEAKAPKAVAPKATAPKATGPKATGHGAGGDWATQVLCMAHGRAVLGEQEQSHAAVFAGSPLLLSAVLNMLGVSHCVRR